MKDLVKLSPLTIKSNSLSKSVFLDAQSTKPLDPRVLDAMMPYYVSIFGNPHSRTHTYGWNAEKGVDQARTKVAKLIGADDKDVIFTSGATESNNTALKGVAHFMMKEGKPVHIITTQIEHKCILDTCRHLEEEGVRVTYLPVQENGIIDLDVLEKSISEDTCLVSVMAVNNEVGVVQPLKKIGEICRRKNVLFHTDAAQAYGHIPLNVQDMNIDLMSISGHKIYGPKGVGALYVRRKPRVHLDPLINGGGQERGIRSGTAPTPLCVGLGKAAEICQEEMRRDMKYVERLSSRLKKKILDDVEATTLNGDETEIVPGCINLSFAFVEGEGLMMKLKDVAVSSGSACTSSSLEPSYVLRAMGKKDDMAHSSIRFGINKFNTKEEVDKVATQVVKAVKDLRQMSPLYEMVKDGIDLDSIKWSE